MGSTQGGRHEPVAAIRSIDQMSPELKRLIEAQVALDEARRNAKWRRKCKTLQAAAHAVQEAALAAHGAGVGWREIGDALGIERALPQSDDAPAEPHTAPHPTSVHHFPEQRDLAAG